MARKEHAKVMGAAMADDAFTSLKRGRNGATVLCFSTALSYEIVSTIFEVLKAHHFDVSDGMMQAWFRAFVLFVPMIAGFMSHMSKLRDTQREKEKSGAEQ